MKNQALNINYGSLVADFSSHITGIEKPVMKVLATAKPCIWDVTESYCSRYGTHGRKDSGKRNEGALKFLRKMPTVGTMTRKELTVTINGITNVWTLGKKNEYYLNGKGLTETLEITAKGTGNKITIA